MTVAKAKTQKAGTKRGFAFMDLTVRAPRSARVRLGGFVILPRVLDKGRASLAGKNGEYNYNCPLDEHFFRFVGVEAGAMLKQLALGKGDGEILQWIHGNSRTKPNPWQINTWSAYHEHRVPTDLDSREFFQNYHQSVGRDREDIAGWFDVLDLDDFVSFGGKA
jgi:hypothetical protein